MGAWINSKNNDMPAQLTLPSFEPHPDPKPVFETIFATWGSGEFAAEETKQAAMDKFNRSDIVMDVSSSLLPDVFKVYHGTAGVDAWANGVIGQWEFTRFDSTTETGLKPGCVMQKLDVDVKHKGTGKEATGIRIFNELAYDADGLCTPSSSGLTRRWPRLYTETSERGVLCRVIGLTLEASTRKKRTDMRYFERAPTDPWAVIKHETGCWNKQ